MSKKRILIVDDDWDILFLLTHSVKRLSADYEVITAMDGPDALQQINNHTFNLVITDHMMPQMTGLQLAQTVREKSPATKIILMTAYNPDRIPDSFAKEELDAFIGKPFKIPEVAATITKLLNETNSPDDLEVAPQFVASAKMIEALETLWYNNSLNLIMLSNSKGVPLHVIGEAQPDYLARMAKFVADNFFSVSELASLLGDNKSSFQSSYYEGNQYNIYAYHINASHFLTIMFDADKKPGPIWIYTKKTAQTLAELFEK